MIKIIVFHLLGVLQFGFGCYYDAMYVTIPSTSRTIAFSPFGGKLKYLTYLNALLQTAYFAISLVNDIIGTNEPSPAGKPLIRRVKDVMFSSLAFPLSIFVGTTFWGIYAVDRELILPRSLDAYFPLWLNHVMHTNIVVFSVIELVTSFRMYPSRKTALSLLGSFMLCYVIWIHVIYFHTGVWVYPILSVLNWPLRVMFYLFSLGLVCGLFVIGERMNEFVWGNEIQKTVKGSKKKSH
ncbi:androgen-dependent TFPI-regulating protein [Amyelois transitella]|uniref:androgen-dependent TFPI-regulating protein n=1 Tax=Amyelois transitella TaxID=680683 RepID=UPI00067D60B2|nr:androgen-dependent TFPI-regulating protein [Amyelois transitella]